MEQPSPEVGKILFGLLTNPSNMYPRVVSRVCKDQSVVRDASVSNTGLDQLYYNVQ